MISVVDFGMHQKCPKADVPEEGVPEAVNLVTLCMHLWRWVLPPVSGLHIHVLGNMQKSKYA